ncbi:MAG: biopolymer transporter ExbD [Xenophilus sp.]
MHFRHGAGEAPEINLIPFIDVLLVILIFLMLSTTYSKFTEMEVRLPAADAEPQRDRPREIVVAVGADGRYAVDRTVLPERGAEAVAAALRAAAGGRRDSVVVISADAAAAHQSVITVMEAARRSGLMQITFATQPAAQAAR